MKQEIERKFLVRTSHLPSLNPSEASSFAQGYLSADPVVRVRRAEKPGHAPKAWLTIKGPGMLSRAEFEYEIPANDAMDLLQLCRVKLTKRRHIVRVEEYAWEVDEFTGAHEGLWIAEIELKSPDEVFARPAWLGAEVTDDSRYTNAALAEAGVIPG